MPVHVCGSRCAREGPSSEADLARGGVSPRARRTSLEGVFGWAASVGRGGRHDVDRVVCMLCVRPKVGFAFHVFCGF
jgi:hypothetical protein